MVPETFEEFVSDYIECVPERNRKEVLKGLSKLGVLCPVSHGGVDSLTLGVIIMGLEERYSIKRIPTICYKLRRAKPCLKVFDIHQKLLDTQRKGRLRFVTE